MEPSAIFSNFFVGWKKPICSGCGPDFKCTVYSYTIVNACKMDVFQNMFIL